MLRERDTKYSRAKNAGLFSGQLKIEQQFRRPKLEEKRNSMEIPSTSVCCMRPQVQESKGLSASRFRMIDDSELGLRLQLQNENITEKLQNRIRENNHFFVRNPSCQSYDRLIGGYWNVSDKSAFEKHVHFEKSPHYASGMESTLMEPRQSATRYTPYVTMSSYLPHLEGLQGTISRILRNSNSYSAY